MRILPLFIVCALSLTSAFAEECATSVSQLRAITGHSDLSMKWIEKTSNKEKQLTLKLTNGSNALNLDLSVPAGNWANVDGMICKTGADTFEAKVIKMTWGPQAGSMLRLAGKPKIIKLQLTYTSVMKVTAKGVSIQFNALE